MFRPLERANLNDSERDPGFKMVFLLVVRILDNGRSPNTL
jgi:hypothetical protein